MTDTAQSHPFPGMSYWDIDTIEWEQQTPQSRRKILRLEDDLYVAIVQWDAGFTLPAVDHHGGEETVYILTGTFVDQYRTSGAGSVIRGEAGSSHTPSTPDGVTFFAVRRLTEGERERIAPNWTSLP
jgi:anti-sigma factor ChrR (cupin superfamily)